ncbi:hypothetical protein C8J55DRAFT_610039 [Lentinula edodes]|uniref:Uncharacterized protein n=1 Tax=Lentinula lateritia TaxID=40482 RepID=A0A9W9DD48_9AGAR|nr:hypothetical protein C8J55DRAFT_610039 [Lentinula edodes]
MQYSQFLHVLLSVALALYATTVTASPIPAAEPEVHETGLGTSALGKRTIIELYHVTTAAFASSIKTNGPELQVKPTIGDDFNPKGKGGFYVSDNKEGILKWCKARQVDPKNAKTNCADLVTFEFDESALTNLKYHRFTSPTSKADEDAWMNTSDFEQWLEFTSLCTHGIQSDPGVKLAADLANGGDDLDLIIGPMVGTETLRQYTFRTTTALAHLTHATVTKTGI